MKHLKTLNKLFESSSVERTHFDFFERISSHEFNLPSEYNDNPYYMINRLRHILPKVEYKSVNSISNSISFRGHIGSFDIKFSSDEWFRVKFVPINQGGLSFWKCDQIEGLIELLKYLRLL